MTQGRPGLFVGTTDSLGERIQRLIPDGYVVKSLNVVKADVMINPGLTGDEPDMFIAGNRLSVSPPTVILAFIPW
jgi:8-hydroxy-5-deazaflavin:NADPH oxidoreductase